MKRLKRAVIRKLVIVKIIMEFYDSVLKYYDTEIRAFTPLIWFWILRRRGILQNFRLSKIGSKISYIQWTKLSDILVSYFSQKGFHQFCEIKEHSVRKVGNRSCSTFPLNLGIYYSRAFWACNKHFNKDLTEAFKVLKCFKYKQPRKLIFFRKVPRTSKTLDINVGLANFSK